MSTSPPATQSTEVNPLRDGLTNRPQPKACSLVIFGATGDLTHRKLIPALYNLAADGDLPPGIAIIGFARRDKSDEVFRKEMEEATRKFSRQPVKDELWNAFAQSLFYHRSDFDNDDGYRTLAERLDKLDAERATGGRRMFYLAAGPEQFDPIISRLAKSGLNKAGAHADSGAGEGWSRVIVEKPFGTDLPSAHKLNEVVASAFHESNTYRIDHFLGKETAQNIMVLRFANSIFEPIWNARYIDHIEITAAETLGVEARAGYYETSGALRDMVQNHLIQLLTLVCMEPPTDLRADSVRDEKVKVLRSLRPMKTADDVKANVIRGQYSAGSINGKEAPAYRNEQNVKPGSMTETFVAMRVRLDNWRWSGVPIYVRVGKRLPKSGAEISVHLKNAPGVLFNQRDDGATPTAATDPGAGANVLVIRIQPEEGVSLRMQSKLPGAALRIEPVKMDFQYGESFGKASPEAYERLLLDAMSGDPTLFARRDEVEEAWGFVDSIEQAWHDSTEGSATSKAGSADAPQLFEYAAGSWGPKEADDLLARDGRTWRRF